MSNNSYDAKDYNVFLMQINPESRYFDTHSHSNMELAYILSGKVINTINGVETEIKKGDCYFINPGASHKDILFDTEDEKGRMIICTFYPQFINPVFEPCTTLGELLFDLDIYIDLKNNDELTEPVSDPLSTYYHDDSGYVKHLFLQCLQEYNYPDVGSEEIIRNNIINILIILLRNRKIISNAPSNDPFSVIYDYMLKNYMDEITLESVADLVGYSAQYVGKHFAEKTGGDHFKQVLKRIRIKNACSLMINSNKSISEIIGLVGYKDAKTFYGAFKEFTNTTPVKYRKSHKRKADWSSPIFFDD